MRRYEEEAHPFENRHCFVFVQVATVTAPARDRKKTVGVVAAGKPTSPVTVSQIKVGTHQLLKAVDDALPIWTGQVLC